MNDEVKEILDFLDDDNRKRPFGISNRDSKILRDYITNLQEENEKVHKDFDELSERYFFTKSRNEKAIEYNKKNIHSQTLDNILQGSDKE
jgi:hypothetical protein